MGQLNPLLTSEDREFLGRPLHGFLSPGGAEPRPVWFELSDEDEVQIFSGAQAPKVRRLQANPTASLVVAAPVGDPERWISVAGSIAVHGDGAEDLCVRLGARYWDLQDRAAVANLEAMIASDLVRLVLTVERVSRG
jgi:hypothetical protein